MIDPPSNDFSSLLEDPEATFCRDEEEEEEEALGLTWESRLGLLKNEILSWEGKCAEGGV